MRRIDIVRLLAALFAVIDVFMFIFGGIYLATASKKIRALQLTPNFTETDLGLDSDYSFTASITPSKASFKKVKVRCDDPNSTFKMDKNGNATLHTSAEETTVTVYLEYKGIKSNVMTFQVMDLVAKAAADAEAAAIAQAEAEAKAAEEAAAAAEAAEAARTFVKMIGDNVNIRSTNSTDGESLGKAYLGDIFEKVEYIEDWTHILYNEQDGYIKSEFLTEISRSEALGLTDGSSTDITIDNIDQQEEEKEQVPGTYTEEQLAAAQAAMQQTAADAAQKAADELKAAQEAAAAEQAQAEAAAAEAAAQQAAAGTVQLQCKDGMQTFTQQQYNFLAGFWYREGEDDWKVHALVHTKAEIIQICQIEGNIY